MKSRNKPRHRKRWRALSLIKREKEAVSQCFGKGQCRKQVLLAVPLELLNGPRFQNQCFARYLQVLPGKYEAVSSMFVWFFSCCFVLKILYRGILCFCVCFALFCEMAIRHEAAIQVHIIHLFKIRLGKNGSLF